MTYLPDGAAFVRPFLQPKNPLDADFSVLRLRVLTRSETECLAAANPAVPRVIWELENNRSTRTIVRFCSLHPFFGADYRALLTQQIYYKCGYRTDCVECQWRGALSITEF